MLGPVNAASGYGPESRSLFGVRVFTDSVAEDNVIGVWDSKAVAVALRQDVGVESDRSRYFDSDSTAVRATLRAAWHVLAPSRVVKIAVE